MKILYVVTQGEAGGAQKYVLELAKDFDGAIATGSEADSLVYQADDQKTTVYRLYHLKRSISPLDDPFALWDLIRLARATKPDIVHLNSSKAGFLGSLIRPFVKAKIVYTAHGFVFNEPGSEFLKSFYQFLERFASRFRDAVIAVSEKDYQSALDHYIIGRSKLYMVHNGLPDINFLHKDSARQYLALPMEKTIIGTIANLYYTKGIDILIEATAKLTEEQRSHVCVAIIGEGEGRDGCERLIEENNLHGVVKLLGHRELASHYLRGFDLFVLPSRKEGFPYALLEAMQAGLPIIATDVGGNREAIGDAGVLVPSEDPQALADALTGLIFGAPPQGGSAKLEAMSLASLNRSKEFSLEKMLAGTKRVYESLFTTLH